MKQKRQLIALPTDNKSHLLNNTYKFTPEHGNPWEYRSQVLEDAINRGYIFHYLYLLSDEEIKEGDWMATKRGEIARATKDNNHPIYGDRKIIATTNPHLKDKAGYTDYPFPADIPQSLIEYFVEKQGKVDSVMVEYED